MAVVKVIDLQRDQKYDLPKAGEGNWMDWLADQGYLICDRIPLGYISLELYRCECSGVYALYHPSFQGLSTECLFFNIPGEAEAQELVSLAKQMVGIMAMATQFKGTA